MAREVAVVPHTHWDREWYAAFQTFRLKLVDLVDDLLPLLDRDPSYAHFMLDGQMAVLDDYLAVRPDETEHIRRLAASGRLGVGPWYILMDEFLVSGETIVRDLQLGLERAAGFGGAMPVGYLPDMFGHVAQMPQLLRQFGFDHAVVWRGVPAAIDRSGFWWEAPDGSTVRAEYLADGYGNGANLPDDAKDLVEMIRRFDAEHAGFLVGPILWMNGTDHLLPQPWLGRLVAEANALQDDYHLSVSTLADYLAQAPTSTATGDLPRWQGELRSGARANLLMGVGSNRVDVKQAAAAAERSIERLAEPLSALHLPPERWPAALLDEAWLQIVRNSAHDSSCACSIDEVCDAVLHRYAEARQIGEGLTERALAALAASLAAAGPVVVNPVADDRGGLVELRLPGTDPYPGLQVLEVNEGGAGAEGVSRSECVILVQMALDNMPELHGADVEIEADGVLDIKLHYDPDRRGGRYTGPARALVAEAAAERPDGPARITIVTPPSQQVLAHVADVPGYGWQRWEPTDLSVPPVEVAAPAPDQPVTVSNGLVTVTVDPTDGTFALTDPATGRTTAGLGRLVDDGDAGDTYNYSPPRVDVTVDTPDAVSVRVTEPGPLRARVAIERTYRWPARVFFGERGGEVSTVVTSTVEVAAGRAVVAITTELDNHARDHRLRVLFPLPEPADHSTAECAFTVVERGLTAEGGDTEKPLPTFPSRRFVIAGGLTVVHDGLLEYELVDEHDGAAHALALTLLRATGLLSNGPMTNRPLPAGPIIPVEGAQVQGRHALRYGVALGDDVGAAYDAVDDTFVPLLIGRAPGGGTAPDRGQALRVTGAEVSAVVRRGGPRQVRVFNPTPRPSTVTIEGATGWLLDLRGRPLEPFEGSFALGPWRLATAQLD